MRGEPEKRVGKIRSAGDAEGSAGLSVALSLRN
jgi:hypothetical protein